jgi:transcriptional regulator with XRE-family HTH domain
MLAKHFLENLRTLMGGMKQTTLGEQCGIPRGRITSWFSRKVIPDAEDIELLAKYFGVEPYYFFMSPGTQGNAKSIERHDDFSAFIDGLAEKYLTPGELAEYKLRGGSRAYLKSLRENFETAHIDHSSWVLKLNAQVAKYINIDLVEKIRATMSAQGSNKA